MGPGRPGGRHHPDDQPDRRLIINNAISILSAGNAVVFNVHPNAKRCSAENVRLLNRAIAAAGGPPDLVTAVSTPTLETAKALMTPS